MRFIRLKPFEARTDVQMYERLEKGLENEKGLKLVKLMGLRIEDLRKLEAQLEGNEVNFPGSTIVLTRIITDHNKEGRFAMFAVQTRKIMTYF